MAYTVKGENLLIYLRMKFYHITIVEKDCAKLHHVLIMQLLLRITVEFVVTDEEVYQTKIPGFQSTKILYW